MALRRSELAAALDEDYPSTFLRLQRMFRARGIPPEESADLAQETAARLLSHLDRRGDVAPDPGPLIHRIATNLMIDRARSHARRVVSLNEIEMEDPPAKDDPHEDFARRHKTFTVRRAISQLSDKQRLVMALSLDGLSPGEIGGALGIERNAVDALLHRGRRTLADKLRHVKDELQGLALLPLFKLRALMHRGASSEAQAAALSPAMMNAIGAALAIAITGGGLAGGATGGLPAMAIASGARARVVTAHVQPRASSVLASRPAANADPSAHRSGRLAVDVRNHSVDFNTKDNNSQIQVWQTPNADPGVVTPYVNSATDRLCSITPSTCK